MNPSTGETHYLDTYVGLANARADLLMGGELVPVTEAEIPRLQATDQKEREHALRSRPRMTFRDLEKRTRRLEARNGRRR